MDDRGLPVSWPAWQLATRHLQRRESRETLRVFRATQYAFAADDRKRQAWARQEQMNAGYMGRRVTEEEGQ